MSDQRLIGMTAEATGNAAGRDWKVRPPLDPKAPVYPQVGSHIWQCWPAMAVEVDGYGGISIFCPGSGRELYVHGAYYCGAHADRKDHAAIQACDDCQNRGVYDAIRAALDTAQAIGFFDEQD